MPFSSQFSLSLELTKLVPLNVVGGAIAKKIFQLARDLQNSGSGIIIEEDLANIFGKSRMNQGIERNFKTFVTREGASFTISEEVILRDGPGPTVIRAVQEPQYLSTVIQLAFLTWTHEKSSLARAIAQALELRYAAAPDEFAASIPSQDAIFGVLQAIEEQSSTFTWNELLQSVANHLNLSPTRMIETIPFMIFCGILDMFPYAQRFPEDRLVCIKTTKGVCALVTWAHYLLDMSVVVQFRNGREDKDVNFGNGNPTIIIEVPPEKECLQPSLTLLEASKEPLLNLTSGSDDMVIDASHKVRARGYAREMLGMVIPDMPQHAAIVEEMETITSAFAWIICRHLVLEKTLSTSQATDSADADTKKCLVSSQQLLKAARFLFDNPTLNEGCIVAYMPQYSSAPLDGSSPPPASVESAKKWLRESASQEGIARGLWTSICSTAQSLSVLIIAFAHVWDISQCDSLLLHGSLELLSTHNLVRQLPSWQGRQHLRVFHDAWFQAVALLLVGHRAEVDWMQTCLLSDKGWSVFLNTLSESDPSHIDARFFTIIRGVPCRNGVYKRCIIDGPTFGPENPRWRQQEAAGEMASLRCSDIVELGSPLYGEKKLRI
jgi:hypothetical protein